MKSTMKSIKRRKSLERRSVTPVVDDTIDTYISSDECMEVESWNKSVSITPPTNVKKTKSYPQMAKVAPNDVFTKESANVHTGSGNNYMWLMLFSLFPIGFYIINYYISNHDPPYKECTFNKLRYKYRQDEKLVWRTLTVGIENILNKRSPTPGVYLFLHKGGNDTQNLVKHIALESSHCFGENKFPVEMESDAFTSETAIEDYGIAIEKFREKIKEGPVILIANLNKIPAEAAQALHTICDTHSPIANDVLIFLTLVVPSTEGNAVQKAQNALINMWGSKLSTHVLDALITRITDQVIPLKS